MVYEEVQGIKSPPTEGPRPALYGFLWIVSHAHHIAKVSDTAEIPVYLASELFGYSGRRSTVGVAFWLGITRQRPWVFPRCITIGPA